MYKEDEEYCKFLRDNLIITSEPLSVQYIQQNVLNPKLDWDWIYQNYQDNKITVIDDFLIPDIAIRLQQFMLFYNKKEDFYNDYAAVNFYSSNTNGTWFSLLTCLIKGIITNFKHERPLDFIRAWSFIYENRSQGVTVHADPASINFNLWVTPDNCLGKKIGSNGLDIWKIYPPKDWLWKDYNRNTTKIESFLSDFDSDKISIDYRFNRMIVFDSNFFHRGQPIIAHDGYKNRRINYTFLFN